MGIAHFTCLLLAKCSKLSQRMLLVALPMRNTEYSSRLIEPERAPTTRSVPLMVLAKLARASVRTRSTASNRQTDRAMANTVSRAVKRRLARLARARRNRYISNLRCGAGRAIEFCQGQVTVKQRGQALVMADKQQAGAGSAAFGEQQLQKGFAGVGVQRRSGLVGDYQFGLANQGACCGDPLLLADGQGIGAPFQQVMFQPQVGEQGVGGLADAAVALLGAAGTQLGEVAGQVDVLPHPDEQQQGELLKDVAGVIDAKMIAGTGRQLGQVLPQQGNRAAVGLLHPAEQPQQGGLAATTRALEEQGFACRQMERGNIQQFGVAGPGEAEVTEGQECSGHGGHLEAKKLKAAQGYLCTG